MQIKTTRFWEFVGDIVRDAAPVEIRTVLVIYIYVYIRRLQVEWGIFLPHNGILASQLGAL